MYRLHSGIMASGDGLYAAVRSFGPAAWYQPGVGVTGTLTASNWADQSGNGRDLAQGTAGNQPIYLPYSGTAYGYLPGVASNYFSTPDSSAASVTGDIDIRFKAAADDWTPAAAGGMMTKGDTAGVREWEFFILTGGTLRFNGNSHDYDSTATVPTADAAITWLRVTRASATGAVNFYTGVETAGVVAWTQLGSTVTSSAGALTDGANIVTVGLLRGIDLPFFGKVYRAQMFKTIGSATSTSVDDASASVDFNPSTFAETSTNGATATASTGEVWTLNSTGAKPAQIVKSASLLFDGTDDYLATAAFTLDQPCTFYLVAKQVSWTSAHYILSDLAGSGPIISQFPSSPNINLFAGSAVANNANLTVGAKGIVSAVFDGASSMLQVNATTATTGNAGASGADGLILAATTGGVDPGNLQAYELLAFSAAHSAAERSVVQNYLAATHRIAL